MYYTNIPTLISATICSGLAIAFWYIMNKRLDWLDRIEEKHIPPMED